MKSYDEKAINMPKVKLDKIYIEAIKNISKDKCFKQSKIIKTMLRSYYESTSTKLVNSDERLD